MKNLVPILCLLVLMTLPIDVLAQRIRDVHGHTLQDAAYQQAAPIDRLLLLSQWVGERRTSEDAVRLIVRREATKFLQQQANLVGRTNGMSPQQSEAVYRQMRSGGGGLGRATARGGVPDQRMVAEEMQARRDVQQVIRDAAVQREFGGRLVGWYMLNNLAVRGGPLQEIEIPGDLMDEVCMRVLFDDIRWTDPNSTPEIRLRLLEEVRRQRLWSPMLDHLAQAEIAQQLHIKTRGMPRDDQVIAQLTMLRDFKKKELLNWGPYHRQMEERLLLEYLDGARVAAAGAQAKLVHLRRLEAEQMISSMTRTKFEVPYALEYLQAKPGFLGSSAGQKREIIGQMRRDRMIDFLSVSTLEVAFGAR